MGLVHHLPTPRQRQQGPSSSHRLPASPFAPGGLCTAGVDVPLFFVWSAFASCSSKCILTAATATARASPGQQCPTPYRVLILPSFILPVPVPVAVVEPRLLCTPRFSVFANTATARCLATNNPITTLAVHPDDYQRNFFSRWRNSAPRRALPSDLTWRVSQ